MKKITADFIKTISDKAKHSERKRANHNFHSTGEDPINRMINAVEPDAYFPPHKHETLEKREIFIILEGKVAVVEFDEEGKVKDHMILDADSGNFGVEIPVNSWHTIIPLESSVLYEIKDGPYDPSSDKKFAEWAPREDEEGGLEFAEKILKELNKGGAS